MNTTTTTKIQITHGADTYMLSANFADAASPILLDGRATPYQVADARHRLQDAVTLVMDWICSQSGDDMEGSWMELDTEEPRRGPLVTTSHHLLEALDNEDESDIEEHAETLLNEEDDTLTPEEDARVLRALIDADSDIAPRWARERCKRHTCEIVEDGEEKEEQNEDGYAYTVAARHLAVAGVKVAEWTICAAGFYVSSRSNPNHHIGWNVEEADEGDDGIPYDCILRDVLEELGLDDEATELPEVPEPPAAEECSEQDASACVLFRNPYTQGMEDWEPRSFHPSEADAQKAIDEAFRDFRAANSDNSYGPEWTIGIRDDSGAWVPMEDAE